MQMEPISKITVEKKDKALYKISPKVFQKLTVTRNDINKKYSPKLICNYSWMKIIDRNIQMILHIGN